MAVARSQAYKQMVKLEFKRGRYEEMMTAYKQMLTYIKSAVTRNYSEKVINKVLDLVSAPGGMGEGRQMELLHDFYETTLTALQEAKNDRLWFKTNLKLGKLWFDREEYGRLLKILKELHKSCQGPDGADDPQKGTQLLEVYALEIQMHTATKNNKKLKSLYAKALQIKSAIPHPKIMVCARAAYAPHALCAESTCCGPQRARPPSRRGLTCPPPPLPVVARGRA